MTNTPLEKILEIHAAQKTFFTAGATRSVRFRKEALKTLHRGLTEWSDKLCDALYEDLHKSRQEAYLTEIGLLLNEISSAGREVRRWARRRHVHTPLTIFPSKSYIVKEPLGQALIIAPWNYPVQLLLNPLVGAISAGCTAILKPSPYVPHVSAVLEEMINELFPREYIAVVQGDRVVNGQLLELRHDIIFFTGSPSLGRRVMAAAAKSLTPVVLELGGKSPCIVDKSADIKIAARRCAWGKCLNSGQTCIAPDYLFVHEDIKDEFVREFGEAVRALYGGERVRHSEMATPDPSLRFTSHQDDAGNVLCHSEGTPSSSRGREESVLCHSDVEPAGIPRHSEVATPDPSLRFTSHQDDSGNVLCHSEGTPSSSRGREESVLCHSDAEGEESRVTEGASCTAGLSATSEHYGHIVREEAFDRLVGYLSEGTVVYGGRYDREHLWIEPTLLDGVSVDSPVMTEEVFGPIFPLNTFKDIADVQEFVTSREKPLAFYYFGSRSAGWDLIARTSSGGACINDTIYHIVNPLVPFGGVGASGMGSYHGKRSFDAFTHERAVIVSPTWIDLPFRYMPYKWFGLIKKLLK